MRALLEQARRLGFLGPGPVGHQLERSLAFAQAASLTPHCAVDLGTGGGLPGLVLALAWPDSEWWLVESNQRRSDWLTAGAARLGISRRCQVLCDRAEDVARGPLRQSADLVTARSFAPPGPTAECAAPLLKLGGELLVAEPPLMDSERWPNGGLGLVGLEMRGTLRLSTPSGTASISRFSRVAPCPDLYPRRVGVPFKRPIF